MRAAFHEGDELCQVAGGGVGVEQGGLEPEAAVRLGAAEDRAALGEERAADRGDGPVGRALGPEEDGGEGGAAAQVEAGGLLHQVGEVLGPVHAGVDEGAEPGAAEGAEGDGDLEDVGAAGGPEGAAEEVGETGLGVVVGVEVVGGVAEDGEVGGVAYGEESGGGRLPAEFVQVDGDGTGPVEAVEEPAVGRAEEDGASVGGVDVEFGAVGRGDVGELRERVDEALVGGSGGGDDEDGAGEGGQGRVEGRRVDRAAGGGTTTGSGRPRSQAARWKE